MPLMTVVLVRSFFRLASYDLTLTVLAVALVLPVGCYSRSAQAKVRRDIEGWYFWHGKNLDILFF
jgi:hypothetical protein